MKISTTGLYGLVIAAGMALSQTAAATLITTISASTDMATETGYTLENIINGSGLASGPSLTGEHANASEVNAWLSTDVTGSIIFDLGGTYDLEGFTLWNTNWNHTIPNEKGKYGIDKVTIMYSLNGSAFTAIGGATTSFPKENAISGISPASYSFQAIRADMVKFTIKDNHNGPASGLAEVHFDGTRVSREAADDINRVPEPATLGLLCLGLAGIGFSRRAKTM